MKQFIIITGPTAAGKTDFALTMGTKLPIEIINGDMGQLYAPLTIGTAKPSWKTEKIPHHLFDVLESPRNYTVAEYRQEVEKLIIDIHSRGNIPVIVGGSFFYLRSLFFPPRAISIIENKEFKEKYSWELLHTIDPERAAQVNKNDAYRIGRALDIWFSTGIKPSENKPLYNPIKGSLCRIIFATQKRPLLYTRINNRAAQMLKGGWVNEVEGLSKEWRDFLHVKKIIGYAEIDTYLNQFHTATSIDPLIKEIQQKTRNYAKRQETAWRSLKKDLSPYAVKIDEIDLTLSSLQLYIDGLLNFFKEI